MKLEDVPSRKLDKLINSVSKELGLKESEKPIVEFVEVGIDQRDQRYEISSSI